jgi:hypothetical protein
MYLQKRFLLPDPIPLFGTAEHTDHDAARAPNGHAMFSVYSFAPWDIKKKGSALGFVAPPAKHSTRQIDELLEKTAEARTAGASPSTKRRHRI